MQDKFTQIVQENLLGHREDPEENEAEQGKYVAHGMVTGGPVTRNMLQKISDALGGQENARNAARLAEEIGYQTFFGAMAQLAQETEGEYSDEEIPDIDNDSFDAQIQSHLGDTRLK